MSDPCTLDEAKETIARLRRGQEEAIRRGFALIAVQQRCLDEIAAEAKYGVHGGGSGPSLARKLMQIVADELRPATQTRGES